MSVPSLLPELFDLRPVGVLNQDITVNVYDEPGDMGLFLKTGSPCLLLMSGPLLLRHRPDPSCL